MYIKGNSLTINDAFAQLSFIVLDTINSISARIVCGLAAPASRNRQAHFSSPFVDATPVPSSALALAIRSTQVPEPLSGMVKDVVTRTQALERSYANLLQTARVVKASDNQLEPQLVFTAKCGAGQPNFMGVLSPSITSQHTRKHEEREKRKVRVEYKLRIADAQNISIIAHV
ncbi:unnamed protein product [Protopolystoma xenopodis]|uniref:Uncharacterized protein n=1 Tax=Protopolystoma xenopodis TaxID=117903 RepID=A0A448WSN3_9PLAT|nr:unnamed protein product [Protopolystoma xenopodis]